ncbi:sushi, von Willebrand factor type A, EGF and pentraxin domain-containing protein 1 isoform X1 [Nematostella vectensis]|uniref:sushi, von Willebrand factor type A, EGF and pentraxin domain-containing protein 1 isoform X1 n=1 Tax=Nematostella vectensis TaxID=45351 RepID=UPI00207778A2|nr:sushi, von Willebrand factor type A, EGF and pentraxin domain-containing protein 1 isoform X1 [Nematostella vectensis]
MRIAKNSFHHKEGPRPHATTSAMYSSIAVYLCAKFKSSFLVCFIFILIKSLTYGENVQEYFRVRLDEVLDFPSYKISNRRGQDICGFECSREKECRSFNVGENKSTGFYDCFMLRISENSPQAVFTAKQGFNHYSKLSPCVFSPCSNGATCVLATNHDSYSCTCYEGYTSRHCETGLEDFDIYFPSTYGNTKDFVIISYNSSVMTSLTLSFWLRTGAGEESCLVSYATDTQDDEFTLCTAKNLRLYVNGVYMSSGVSVNDNHWHYIVVTWSNDAPWSLFKDGVNVFTSSTVLQPGHVIPGSGTVVLGQDQDAIGGGFDVAEALAASFVSQVNLWNSVLNEANITELAQACRKHEGNTWRWSDFRSGVNGDVVTISPSRCGET